MKSHFSFGKDGIEITVPDAFECHEIRSRTAAPLEDEVASIYWALDHPIDSEPLTSLAAGKRTAAISGAT